MDLFKFHPGPDPTILVQGEAINGASGVTWTERYREPGEFSIDAPMSSGLVNFLPLGTMISHVNTLEVMVVENQNIKDNDFADPIVSISGRSLVSVLEDRIVGANTLSSTVWITDYTMVAEPVSIQVMKIINEHIRDTTDPNDVLPGFSAWTGIVTGTAEPRSFGRQDLLKAVQALLAVDNLGIQTYRKNAYTGAGSENTYFIIHGGVDRTKEVIFSWKAGDLETAEYLWSQRKYKSSAFVVGRYVQQMVHTPGYNGYGRATGVVPADDIDGHFESYPNGADLEAVVAKMQVRGRAYLAAQNRINLIRADLSEITKYQYRRDYNIGDIVMVDGNFGEIAPMRVVEYVEIQDENEEKGHPTLETPNPVDPGVKDAN